MSMITTAGWERTGWWARRAGRRGDLDARWAAKGEDLFWHGYEIHISPTGFLVGEANPFAASVPLIRVPATPPATSDMEVVVVVGIAVAVAAVLICTCSVVVLRRRRRERG
ncbi:hypothetical protein [Nonomuraea zeae]|uniref:Uncharacterized protein n=1 Tax=Nonomuraea zeae TaxID=1642303 RepID=A0A5S4GUP8_9ACTN|nr:hypothetical protein [Nonomuraea zeae]TMR36499.1 hypothetical protein ETD85_10970 [Nonomuraea zeae]